MLLMANLGSVSPVNAQNEPVKLESPAEMDERVKREERESDLRDKIKQQWIDDLTRAYQRNEFYSISLDSYLDSIKNDLLVLPLMRRDLYFSQDDPSSNKYAWGTDFLSNVKSNISITWFDPGESCCGNDERWEDYVKGKVPFNALESIVYDEHDNSPNKNWEINKCFVLKKLREQKNSRLYLFDHFDDGKTAEQGVMSNIAKIRKYMRPGSQHIIGEVLGEYMCMFRDLFVKNGLKFHILLPLTAKAKANILKRKDDDRSKQSEGLYCEYAVWDDEKKKVLTRIETR